MSKNMTRKGLAFGAGVSLIGSLLTASPAMALALDEGIPMKPASGPASALAIYAADGATFAMRATPVNSAMAGAGTVKFKITDPNAKFVPEATETTGAFKEAVADNAAVKVNNEYDYVSVTHANAAVTDGWYYIHTDTDLNADNGAGAGDTVILTKDTLVEAYVFGTQVFFKSSNAVAATISNVDGAGSIQFFKGSLKTADADVEVADNAVVTPDAAADTISFALTNFGLGAGTYLIIADAGALQLDDGAGTNTLDALTQNQIGVATVDALNAVTIEVDANVVAANTAIVGLESLVLFQVPGSVRAADNSYVIDSGIDAGGTNVDIALAGSYRFICDSL
jgi:hypothetical protein